MKKKIRKDRNDDMINSNECQEIFKFLGYMNKTEVMKIPVEILKFIKNNRNENFKTNIDKNDLFNFNNLSGNALDFLIYIDNTYWRYKENIDEIKSNIYKEEKENNIPIANNKDVTKEVNVKETAIIEYKEKNFIQMLFNKIKRLFERR